MLEYIFYFMLYFSSYILVFIVFYLISFFYYFLVLFFFFNQNTAYEMRISYWSSYVCSSDLTSNSTLCFIRNLPCQRQSDSRTCIRKRDAERLWSGPTAGCGARCQDPFDEAAEGRLYGAGLSFEASSNARIAARRSGGDFSRSNLAMISSRRTDPSAVRSMSVDASSWSSLTKTISFSSSAERIGCTGASPGEDRQGDE